MTCNNLELGKFDCLQWIGARDEPRDVRRVGAVRKLFLRSFLQTLAWNAGVMCLSFLFTAPHKPREMPSSRVIQAQKDLVDVRDSTASALRASTASALTTTAAAAAAGDKFKEEQVLYKDHDGYENDVQYPSQPPVRLTWFWRELHPVKWFKPVRSHHSEVVCYAERVTCARPAVEQAKS